MLDCELLQHDITEKRTLQKFSTFVIIVTVQSTINNILQVKTQTPQITFGQKSMKLNAKSLSANIHAAAYPHYCQIPMRRGKLLHVDPEHQTMVI